MASEKAIMTLRRFQIRELETRWLRRAAWLGPAVLALVLGAMARGGYPSWRLAAAFAWAAALAAWPIIAAWRSAPGVLDERSYRRAWVLGFAALIGDIVLTGGFRSPFLPLIMVMAVSVNVTFGGAREGHIFSDIALSSFAILYLVPAGWLGPELAPGLVLKLRGALVIAGVLLVRASALALVAAWQRASEDLDRVREGVLGDARLRGQGIESIGAKVAHELKNPLAALKALLQLCVRAPGDPRTAARMEAALGEAVRMEVLLREYLSFARPLDDLRPEPLELGRLAEDVAILLEARARSRGVRLEVRGGARVSGDPRRLREALLNLMTNAVEATVAPGEVVVEAAPSPSGATLRVRDTGEGIPPERLARLGEGMYTSRTDGTGLGVALARAAIAHHGGTIAWESEVGRGTTVTIGLPQAPPAFVAPPAAERAVPANGGVA